MPWPPDLRPREPPGLSARATLVCGLLLGCAIVLLETVQQPIATVRPQDIGVFVSAAGPTWCVWGVAWTFFARFAEPRLGAAGLIAATLLAILTFSAVGLGVDHAAEIAARAPPPRDAFAGHLLWTNAFYGGLYVAAYAGWRRSVRSRRAVARLRQARDESAALWQQSRLDSVRGVLQPQTLVQSVDALRRSYRRDPARGDALLDTLVGFLRPAVRGLAADSARLRDELELAGRYLRLRAETTGEVAGLNLGDPAAAPDVTFPPRLLTPTLEALCLAGGRVRLEAGWREGVFALRMTSEGAGADVLPPALRRRIAATGDEAGVTARLLSEPEALAWTLRFEPQRAEKPQTTAAGAPA